MKKIYLSLFFSLIMLTNCLGECGNNDNNYDASENVIKLEESCRLYSIDVLACKNSKELDMQYNKLLERIGESNYFKIENNIVQVSSEWMKNILKKCFSIDDLYYYFHTECKILTSAAQQKYIARMLEEIYVDSFNNLTFKKLDQIGVISYVLLPAINVMQFVPSPEIINKVNYYLVNMRHEFANVYYADVALRSYEVLKQFGFDNYVDLMHSYKEIRNNIKREFKTEKMLNVYAKNGNYDKRSVYKFLNTNEILLIHRRLLANDLPPGTRRITERGIANAFGEEHLTYAKNHPLTYNEFIKMF